MAFASDIFHSFERRRTGRVYLFVIYSFDSKQKKNTRVKVAEAAQCRLVRYAYIYASIILKYPWIFNITITLTRVFRITPACSLCLLPKKRKKKKEKRNTTLPAAKQRKVTKKKKKKKNLASLSLSVGCRHPNDAL